MYQECLMSIGCLLCYETTLPIDVNSRHIVKNLRYTYNPTTNDEYIVTLYNYISLLSNYSIVVSMVMIIHQTFTFVPTSQRDIWKRQTSLNE